MTKFNFNSDKKQKKHPPSINAFVMDNTMNDDVQVGSPMQVPTRALATPRELNRMGLSTSAKEFCESMMNCKVDPYEISDGTQKAMDISREDYIQKLADNG